MLTSGQDPQRPVAGAVAVEGGAEGDLPDIGAAVRVPVDLPLPRSVGADRLRGVADAAGAHVHFLRAENQARRRDELGVFHHLQQRLADHQELTCQPVAAGGKLRALPHRLHLPLQGADPADRPGAEGTGDQEEAVALEASQVLAGDAGSVHSHYLPAVGSAPLSLTAPPDWIRIAVRADCNHVDLPGNGAGGGTTRQFHPP